MMLLLSRWPMAKTPAVSCTVHCERSLVSCVCTAAAVAFTYLWHITFFGACMALAGYAEKNNRHALTCRKVVPKSESSKFARYVNLMYYTEILFSQLPNGLAVSNMSLTQQIVLGIILML